MVFIDHVKLVSAKIFFLLGRIILGRDEIADIMSEHGSQNGETQRRRPAPHNKDEAVND